MRARCGLRYAHLSYLISMRSLRTSIEIITKPEAKKYHASFFTGTNMIETPHPLWGFWVENTGITSYEDFLF